MILRSSSSKIGLNRGSQTQPCPERQQPARLWLTTIAAGIAASSFSLTSGCGLENPYKKREPRCKVGCDNGGQKQGSDATSQSGLYLRTGTEMPLDAAFWLNQTPLDALSDGELRQILFANPIVQAGPTDPSFAEAASNLEGLFENLKSRVEIAANVTEEQKQSNSSARCFQDAFSAAGKWADNSALSFLVHPGRCFTLEQVSETLQSSGATTDRRVARLYEDSLQITLPTQQGNQQLTLQGPEKEPYSIIQLTDETQNQPALAFPFLSRTKNILQSFSIQTLQIQGTEGRTGSDRFSVTWDYLSAGLDSSDLFSVTYESETLTWTLNGTLVQATGITYNPEGLRLGDAGSGSGYARIITFDQFKISGVTHLRDGFERANGTQEAILSGAYRVDIPQPASAGGTIGLTFRGLGQRCLVDARHDQSPDESLGRIDICTSARRQ